MADPRNDPHDVTEEVVDICRDLLRIDTTNAGDGEGPGERKAAEHVAGLLAEVGLEVDLTESEPGRASVLARWEPEGGTDRSPLLVHGHLDVVPADARDWRVDPFAGEIADGCLWGRGAVDMKDFDAIVLSVVRARVRAGRPPSRPIVLAFTADEEAGGHKGAEVLIGARRELLGECTEAVGEVGGFSVTVRDQRFYLLQAAEKGMAWMRLHARGTAGHGSMRNDDNPVTRLSAAVARIGTHSWPTRLTPAMEVLLAAVGDLAGVEATPENAAALVEEFGPAARMLTNTLRHSVNPTRLDAGYKVNVVPGSATAELDGRFVPGHEDEFFDTLRDLIGDGIDLELLSHQAATDAPHDTDLVAAMNRALLSEDPEARLTPYLMPAGTDGKHWAKLGMHCYGFVPLRLPADLDFTALFHGVDERVPLDSLRFGARVFDRFLDLA